MALNRMATPAGRLLSLLDRACQNNNANVYTAWCSAFGLHPDHRSEVYRRVGLVIELIAATKKAVADIPQISHREYLEWAEPLEKAIKESQWNDSINTISSKFLGTPRSLLGICADQLSIHSPEPVIEQSALDFLLTELRELHQLANSEGIAETLRKYLQKHIFLAIRAIEDYKMQGISSVEIAATISVGAAVMRQKPNQGATGPTRDLLDRYVKTVGAILLTLQTAHAGLNLLEDAAEVVVCLTADNSRPLAAGKAGGNAGESAEGEESPTRRGVTDPE